MLSECEMVLARYEETIKQFAKNEVRRPESVINPKIRLEQALHMFAVHKIIDGTAQFSNPPMSPAHERQDHGMTRSFYAPKDNGDYLNVHRANLKQLKKVLAAASAN
jgi:hypothetical protein